MKSYDDDGDSITRYPPELNWWKSRNLKLAGPSLADSHHSLGKLIPFPGDMILITIRWIAGYLSISSAVNFYFFIARMYT